MSTTARARGGRPARRPTRRAEENREHVLRVASSVIAERGVELTRYVDIAERADVAISSLQYLFGSLEALVSQTVAYQARQYLAAAERGSAAVADPVERLGWLIDNLVTADVSDADARADWLVWVEYWRAAARDESLRPESQDAYERWHAIVVAALEAGVRARVFRPRIEVAAIARGLVAMSDGLGIQTILQPGRVSRHVASRLCRSWVATILDCPALLAR
jgi:AcrR family transcriptional regulator